MFTRFIKVARSGNQMVLAESKTLGCHRASYLAIMSCCESWVHLCLQPKALRIHSLYMSHLGALRGATCSVQNVHANYKGAAPGDPCSQTAATIITEKRIAALVAMFNT